jgi:hypothetical protein
MIHGCDLSLKEAMEISGHKAISTFLRYDIVSLAEIKSSGEKMDTWMKKERARTKRGLKSRAPVPEPETCKIGKVPTHRQPQRAARRPKTKPAPGGLERTAPAAKSKTRSKTGLAESASP